MNLNKIEVKILSRVLYMAYHIFWNHGCNDFELNANPENIVFAKKVYHYMERDDDFCISERDNKIYLKDYVIMEYFYELLKNNNEPDTEK